MKRKRLQNPHPKWRKKIECNENEEEREKKEASTASATIVIIYIYFHSLEKGLEKKKTQLSHGTKGFAELKTKKERTKTDSGALLPMLAAVVAVAVVTTTTTTAVFVFDVAWQFSTFQKRNNLLLYAR